MKIRQLNVLFAVLSMAVYTGNAQQSSTPFIVAVTNINAGNVLALQQPGGGATLEFDLVRSVNWDELLKNSSNPKHLVRIVDGERQIAEAPLFDFSWCTNSSWTTNKFILYLNSGETNKFILVFDTVKTARDAATEISGRGTIVKPKFDNLNNLPAFNELPAFNP
jgi:hypothetical protein